MTPSRQHWRGIETGRPVVVPIRAFGWLVHQHIMPVGTTLKIAASDTVPRDHAPNLALYVRGVATVSNGEGEYPNRVAGLFTGDRPEHPAGITTVTPIEELEFWCFNYHANRGALPDLKPAHFFQGEKALLEKGQRVLVCLGCVGGFSAGESFVATGKKLMVDEPSYVLLIGGERASI
jgi:hypothetical protein